MASHPGIDELDKLLYLLPMIDKQLYHTHETPNAVMHTLAAPSTGAAELAVWTVEMRAGQAGPLHSADREQVWVVLDGALRINGVEHTGTAIIPAGSERRIEAPEDARALVCSRSDTTVTSADGGTRPLPWAA
jgi:quercetin dioxygenase-like cupin family protein